MSKRKQPMANRLNCRRELACASMLVSAATVLAVSLWLSPSPVLATTPDHEASKVEPQTQSTTAQSVPSGKVVKPMVVLPELPVSRVGTSPSLASQPQVAQPEVISPTLPQATSSPTPVSGAVSSPSSSIVSSTVTSTDAVANSAVLQVAKPDAKPTTAITPVKGQVQVTKSVSEVDLPNAPAFSAAKDTPSAVAESGKSTGDKPGAEPGAEEKSTPMITSAPKVIELDPSMPPMLETIQTVETPAKSEPVVADKTVVKASDKASGGKSAEVSKSVSPSLPEVKAQPQPIAQQVARQEPNKSDVKTPPSLTAVKDAHPAPAMAKANASKPKTDESKLARHSREKKAHPIVVAPEPLFPEPDLPSSVTAQEHPANWGASTGVSQAQSSRPRTATVTNNKPGVSASAAIDRALGNVPSERPKTTVNWSALYPAPKSAHNAKHYNYTHQAKLHAGEPGFYPVGYSPAVRSAVNPEKKKALQLAIRHYNLGVYYAQHQQWDEAISEYKQVLSENINMADAYVGLSTAALYKRDWENALKNGAKALRLKHGFMDPANITQASYNLSSVYCVSDDYGKALRYFKKVKKAKHPQTEALRTFLQNTCKPGKREKVE